MKSKIPYKNFYDQGFLNLDPKNYPQLAPEANLFSLKHIYFVVANILLERQAQIMG